jgi:predicted PurR-regulated permease PerM
VFADATTTDLLVAILGGVGLIVVATIPFIWTQVQLHGKVDKLYDHINNVEAGETIEGEDATLGQVVRRIDRSVTEGFERNDDDHKALRSHIEAVQETVASNTSRIDAHRRALDELNRKVGET